MKKQQNIVIYTIIFYKKNLNNHQSSILSSENNLIELLVEHLTSLHIDEEKRRIDNHIENIRDSI